MNDFTLFKLDPAGRRVLPKTAPNYKLEKFYFRFRFRGQRYLRCLETTSAEEGQRKARLIYNTIVEAAIRQDLELLAKTRLRRAPADGPAVVTATVLELLNAYQAGPSEAGTKTRKQNKHALQQLLAVAYPDCDVDQLTIDKINGAVADAWFKSKQDAAGAADAQAEGLSAKRSGNSRFRQAVSLFTPGLLEHYRSKSLHCPSIEEFVTKGRARRFKKVNSSERYQVPSPTIIAATLASWSTLEDRNVFLAAGFALSFGLRAGEISQVKWGYLQIRHNCPALVGAARVKDGCGQIESRALDPFFSQMIQRADAMSWRGKLTEYVLDGTATERLSYVWRRVSSWMQGLGWETQKRAHALRAYAGSKVFQRYSPRAAQLFLNHASVSVTEQYYSHFADKWASSDAELKAMPERWATIEQAQPVRILPTPVPAPKEAAL